MNEVQQTTQEILSEQKSKPNFEQFSSKLSCLDLQELRKVAAGFSCQAYHFEPRDAWRSGLDPMPPKGWYIYEGSSMGSYWGHIEKDDGEEAKDSERLALVDAILAATFAEGWEFEPESTIFTMKSGEGCYFPQGE